MTDPILGGTIDKAVAVALNGLASRQRVISNNLANVDTPGFKASDVQFENALQNAIAQDSSQSASSLMTPTSYIPGQIPIEGDGPSAVDSVQPTIVTDSNTAARVDGNNVDIDQQMVEMAQTTITYNALVQVMSARLAMAKYAASDGNSATG